MRVVFLGTPEFAVPTLRAILHGGDDVAAVYTQPPRPAGRGQRQMKSPVMITAETNGIPVFTPRTLKDPVAQAGFAALQADVGVVVAYGMILPPAILSAPRFGCLNLHASLLPRWRGAAPIQRAVLAGDKRFGASIMQMDAGLDTGLVLLEDEVAVGPLPTAGVVHDALSERGAALMIEALAGLAAGTLTPRPQPAEGVTYAKKITNAETVIDWRRPAVEIDRQVRAFAPAPGAWFSVNGTRVRLLEADPAPALRGAPGTVLDDVPHVACGTGALRLLHVQREGKKPMTAAELLRGFALPPGTRFDVATTPVGAR
ncbi:MAG: methionyl-tRNA formyltransferase [Alphaproteobacteria bacterium]|nr:methionyl-tRNA formyltransferase [Alphaproteobacteria bacterium]